MQHLSLRIVLLFIFDLLYRVYAVSFPKQAEKLKPPAAKKSRVRHFGDVGTEDSGGQVSQRPLTKKKKRKANRYAEVTLVLWSKRWHATLQSFPWYLFSQKMSWVMLSRVRLHSGRERRLPAGRCVASVALMVIVYATSEPTNDVQSAYCCTCSFCKRCCSWSDFLLVVAAKTSSMMDSCPKRPPRPSPHTSMRGISDRQGINSPLSPRYGAPFWSLRRCFLGPRPF